MSYLLCSQKIIAYINSQHLAHRTALVAGLQVWSTSKVLLEAKSQGLIEKIEPYVTNLSEAGMWVSSEVKQRILILAGES